MKDEGGRSKVEAFDTEAAAIVAKYDKAHAAVLPLLHLAQDKHGFITPEIEAWVSKWTEVPVVHVREVVTFYSMFRQKPAGRTHIRFCTGTSCMLAGHEKTLDYLKKKLGIDNGGVTADGKFSLEEAECLCACESAPMLQAGDAYIGNLTEKKIDEMINEKK